MITLPATKAMADLLNDLTIEIDCFCEFKAGVFGGWNLTSFADKSLRFIMMNHCEGDMTLNKLATIVDERDYVFKDTEGCKQ